MFITGCLVRFKIYLLPRIFGLHEKADQFIIIFTEQSCSCANPEFQRSAKINFTEIAFVNKDVIVTNY